MENERREQPAITIEKALERDIPVVTDIANKLKLDPSHPNPTILKKGFLIYSLPAEGYKKRINPNFFVAKEGDAVLGFLMAYDQHFLKHLVEKGEIEHEDGIMHLIHKLEPTEPFIFADQIGLDYENHRAGIGTRLMEQLFKQMKDEQIKHAYGAILHRPIKNEASITFCGRLGATLVGEAENQDGLVWGIYRFVPENYARQK